MTKKETILQLRKQGISIRNIAWKARVAKSYVTRIIKAEKESSFIQPKKKRCPECGRLVILPCIACQAIAYGRRTSGNQKLWDVVHPTIELEARYQP